MSLLNLFEFGKAGSFPENDIEQNLLAITKGRSEHWHFMRSLASAELIVVTSNEVETEGQELHQNAELELLTLNEDAIAVFTSESRMLDNGVLHKKSPYLIISGKDLFSLANGMNLILNPFSDMRKFICGQEIARLI